MFTTHKYPDFNHTLPNKSFYINALNALFLFEINNFKINEV